jgi:UDP-N-acetyl-D-galactosamine dehydrogenase
VARRQPPELSLRNCRIAVIGLGYVGLPLAVEFGKHYETTGFDIDPGRIGELKRGKDRTLEAEPGELRAARRLKFTSELRDLRHCRVYVVTVPTPIDADKRPDLGPLERASESVGKVLKRGDIVIYESTVYPGCTEEVCVPILEKQSGLRFNQDFFAGYSPERINPGDREHRLPTIRKVTSGSTPEAAEFVDKLYGSIVKAGTHKASSMRVAEAAKVIENTQRDVNIALVNELALIFNRLGIDTQEVLEAAGSKWNFLPFRPGLVGGHCIGVDPYYLTHKAQQIGYHPEMILAGRRINDNMALYVAGEVVRLMAAKRIHVNESRILVMGLAFKENTPDLRNSKVAELVAELKNHGARVDVWDPWVSAREAAHEYGIKLVKRPTRGRYDAIVLAVGHRQFAAMRPVEIRRLARRKHVIYDIKYMLDRTQSDGRL